MERSSDHSDLATALAETRPVPHEEFAKKLDERVAAGFPRRSRLSDTPLSGLATWFRGLTPQRLAFAGGTATLAAIAIATVLVAGNDSGAPPVALEQHAPPADSGGGLLSQIKPFSRTEPSSPALPSHASESASSAEVEYGASKARNATEGPARLARFRHRDIERSAEIGLLADPDDVADDSSAVFAAVHDARGVVLHSTTTSGKRAGARFELLIPSARLGDALAAFSAIDEVRTRHEATEDITAPTVDVSEQLRSSRARIDGLLAQLAAAESETEAANVEVQLTAARRYAAKLRAQLEKLERRTDFSRVSVKIESGSSSSDSGGTWGIGDAFGDAGHILGIAAGVTLVGLAVLAPLALICLLAWLAQRTWVRAQRRRALRDA